MQRQTAARHVLQEIPMKAILTPEAPIPAGHYSQAIVHDGLIYVSGLLPIDPRRAGFVPETIEEQTELTLRNVEAVLRSAGTSLNRLLQVTIYLSDLTLWDRVNTIYAKVLGTHRPARAIVPTLPLHFGCLIEIQVIAAVG